MWTVALVCRIGHWPASECGSEECVEAHTRVDLSVDVKEVRGGGGGGGGGWGGGGGGGKRRGVARGVGGVDLSVDVKEVCGFGWEGKGRGGARGVGGVDLSVDVKPRKVCGAFGAPGAAVGALQLRQFFAAG